MLSLEGLTLKKIYAVQFIPANRQIVEVWIKEQCNANLSNFYVQKLKYKFNAKFLEDLPIWNIVSLVCIFDF